MLHYQFSFVNKQKHIFCVTKNLAKGANKYLSRRKWLYICLIAICTITLIFTVPQLVTQPPQRFVAVTFDDLPVITDRDDDGVKLNTTNKLLASITKNKIPTIGFVNENQLFNDVTGQLNASELHLLRAWLKNGLELGNHTYSHINLNELGLAAYEADVVRGEIITKRLLKNYGKKMRYFRHPYLHTGRDQKTKQGLEKILEAHGYIVAPVTIFLEDWKFNPAYDQAFLHGNKAMMSKIGQAYLSYVEQGLDYWERQSVKLFKREIKQVILFHSTTINADYFGAIAERLKKRGYKFITIDEALRDEAYKSKDNYVGDGVSWLHRWALTQGKNFVLDSRPQVPYFVSAYNLDTSGQ